MKARDVMTRDVLTIGQEATVLQAVRLLLQHKISGLPVVDGAGRLVGVVTEGDLLRRTETGTQRQRPRWIEVFAARGALAEDYARSHAHKVADVMTDDPVTVTEDADLEQIVDLMEKRHIKRVPVVKVDRLVGIVSRANLLRAFASVAHAVPKPDASDAELKQRLLDELNKQDWAPVAMLEIVVLNGVVDIWGSVLDDRIRQAIIVLAEGVPGVKAVKDHLIWIDPITGMFVAPAELSVDRTLVA